MFIIIKEGPNQGYVVIFEKFLFISKYSCKVRRFYQRDGDASFRFSDIHRRGSTAKSMLKTDKFLAWYRFVMLASSNLYIIKSLEAIYITYLLIFVITKSFKSNEMAMV